MISQSCSVLKRDRTSAGLRVLFTLKHVILGGAIASLCSSWVLSSQAAERSLQVEATPARALISRKATASVLGTPVVTNYAAFRDYCKNPINTTDLKTLCLYLIEGGPIDASLRHDDEPLTTPIDESDQAFLFQTLPANAIALYQYNPILYQYDKVTLYPRR